MIYNDLHTTVSWPCLAICQTITSAGWIWRSLQTLHAGNDFSQKVQKSGCSQHSATASRELSDFCFGWTQRLQARQSTCICFHFKSLRLRSRALQSLPSAAIMSSNGFENVVPNEENWWKWWLLHILPGSSWFFPPVPGSPACACQQWLVVSASWLQSANRSQESKDRRLVQSCTKPGKEWHHSKGLEISN